MNEESNRCFHTMESALEYLLLLDEAVADARHELEQEVAAANGDGPQRIEALRLALFQMGKLSTHIRKSQCILSDLCLVRGLLQSEAPEETTETVDEGAVEDSDIEFLIASRAAL
jgi:hypothetical protein